MKYLIDIINISVFFNMHIKRIKIIIKVDRRLFAEYKQIYKAPVTDEIAIIMDDQHEEWHYFANKK